MAISAKKALELLTTGAPVPGFDEASVATARALVAAPDTALAAPVAALPAALALAVLEASVRARSPLLALALASSRGDKELVRAAKRALHQLRSAGVDVPEPDAATDAEREPPLSIAPRVEELRCLLTPMDGSGDYGLFLVRPLTGQVEMVQVLVNDELGVQELGRLEGPRSQYRKLMRSLVRDEKAPVVELDAAAARQELGWAVGASIAAHTPFPDGLHTLLRHHGAEPTSRPDLPPPEPDDESLAARSELLFDEPLLEQWLPPEAALRRVAERLTEVDTSPLALSDAQKGQQIRATLRDEAARFFTVPLRRLYAQRLWMAARFLAQYGQPGSADVARAEARRLFHGAAGDPSRFAEGLFGKILKLSAQPKVERASKESPPTSAGPSGSPIIRP